MTMKWKVSIEYNRSKFVMKFETHKDDLTFELETPSELHSSRVSLLVSKDKEVLIRLTLRLPKDKTTLYDRVTMTFKRGLETYEYLRTGTGLRDADPHFKPKPYYEDLVYVDDPKSRLLLRIQPKEDLEELFLTSSRVVYNLSRYLNTEEFQETSLKLISQLNRRVM